MRFGYTFPLLWLVVNAYAQVNRADSIQVLEPVLIQAYSAEKPIEDVAAAVAYLSGENLDRFNNTNLLPAVNTIPGVRMEERSPGSYRFSIRGSLLRSPFGVRNVKAYWNGLPLTDGGGNTYLNLLDFNSIGTLEIIKGPGGSLYGAGTGGVILLRSPTVQQNQSEVSAVAGSFGLHRLQLSHQFQNRRVEMRIHFAGQSYGGYRDQTEMKRYVVNGDVKVPLEDGSMSATFFYSNLFYETPGALTLAQYNDDPRQARPPAGPNRGAVEQKAAVYNQTPYLGLNFDHNWNDRWSTRIGFFGSYSDFENPTIRNYEVRKETNFGVRMQTHYALDNKARNQFTFGAETQSFTGPLTVFDNELGTRGAVQTDDDLTSTTALFFAQLELRLRHGFLVTLGGSLNTLEYTFLRKLPAPEPELSKSFRPFFSPRVALLKELGDDLSLYANVSRGFSPPSLAEVRPSTNEFNAGLQAERGTNYEIGMRGALADKKLYVDVALYDFRLRETIVVQHLQDGADYFINAGSTSQRGIEAMITYHPIQRDKGVITNLKIWDSYSYNHYRFASYVVDDVDYSGNYLTGVPPTTNSFGLDIAFRRKVYANLTGNYVDHIPLNDANEVFANEYFLLGARLGFQTTVKSKHKLDLFAGIDNALDQEYSLGNDLNAVLGGRYFNAAPPRNYYAGVRITLAE